MASPLPRRSWSWIHAIIGDVAFTLLTASQIISHVSSIELSQLFLFLSCFCCYASLLTVLCRFEKNYLGNKATPCTVCPVQNLRNESLIVDQERVARILSNLRWTVTKSSSISSNLRILHWKFWKSDNCNDVTNKVIVIMISQIYVIWKRISCMQCSSQITISNSCM
jgi:hypothetical protein